jgi:diazepam-binding inhibitor (GABA receptor modulating acyl-CoA-binding protein)
MTDKDDINRKFQKYISKAKDLKEVNDSNKLYLYSNYKQALFGDNTNEKPSILNRVEMEKWKAWNSVVGISKEEAMKNYIKKVKELYKEMK